MYMKKQLLLVALAALAVPAFGQGRDITLVDEVLHMDTVFHAKVGPGTTQTAVRLSGAHPLNVFYLTIDKTTPGVSLRTVVGPKLAGNSTVRNMAANNSTATTQYFAGVNGDFYWTSGYASNGSSQVGTPTSAAIVDGEVYKSANSNYQFTVDTEGVARVSRLDFYRGTATCGEATAAFHGINVMSPSNSLTLYTPRFWGSSNQGEYAGNCAEVTARLAEGETFAAGTKFKLVVTSEPNSTGDTAIPDDGFVLFGRGEGSGNTGAKAFVEALKPGDIVEIDNAIYTAEGERITPLQCVSGNPKNVGGGVNLNSEAERGDAKDRHPRTGIGISADGTKIVMMVIDGRSSSSAGVSTGMLGDMMIIAGCHEAVNLDGGGSSTLFTQALGVRNHCSDGSERAVGNAIFATVDGNITDTEVAEIAFMDWRADAPGLGIYRPRVYAFNAAGVMISDDYQDYTLSCPAELGTISADGKALYTAEEGKGVLTASAGTAKASIPVYISTVTPSARLGRVILDGVKDYAAEISATTGSTTYLLRPEAFTWESSDTDVATVSADGVVKGVVTGTATITAKRGETTVSFIADVQLPKAKVQPMAEDFGEWKIRRSAVKTATMTALDNGVAIDYTMQGTIRAPKITLQANSELWSRPDAIRIRARYAKAPTAIELSVRGADERNPRLYTCPEIGAEATEWTVRMSDIVNVDDAAVFPVYLSSVAFAPAEGANEEGHIDLPGLELIFDNGPAGIEEISAEAAAADAAARWYNLQGMEVSREALVPGIYIRRTSDGAEKVAVK